MKSRRMRRWGRFPRMEAEAHRERLIHERKSTRFIRQSSTCASVGACRYVLSGVPRGLVTILNTECIQYSFNLRDISQKRLSTLLGSSAALYILW